MKVNGSGQPPNPGVSGPEGANKPGASETDKTGGAPAGAPVGTRKTPESGKSFAEKVSGPRSTAATHGPAATRSGELAIGDVASELRAGKLTSRAAIEKVLERVVTRQVGPDAPAAVRDRIRGVLQDAIENDPLLAGKLRQLE